MSFTLKILGSNSAIPAYGRNHTAQLLTVNNQRYLIDCGEGTQLQLMKYRHKILKINTIFISHLHGDHYLGLQGLISSMNLLGRTKDLDLFGPPGLAEIITLQLKYSQIILNYKINFHEINSSEKTRIHDDKLINVFAFPLNHKISCYGFIFREKLKPRKIVKEKLPEGISYENIAMLKKGMDITDENGKIIYKCDELTIPPDEPRSYAYCSDTKYDERIIPYLYDVDLLYHEATFLNESEQWAEKTFHSTTVQAGQMAKKSGVGKLLIGHFSARYKDLTQFLEETRKVFQRTELALEGKTFEITKN